VTQVLTPGLAYLQIAPIGSTISTTAAALHR
jgi:hypothetical protein